MRRTAKIFTTGRSQAVRLPLEFRFKEKEVYIRRDPETGDVILSRKLDTWADLLARLDAYGPAPADFMADRNQGLRDKYPSNPFEGWEE
jgi:antitoxin VapB